MNLHERIEKEVAATPEADPSVVAERVLRMCSKNDLAPLLVLAVEARQRAHVRGVEQRRFQALLDELRSRTGTVVAFPSTETAEERLANLRAVLTRTIRLGDGTATTWGQATLDQHRMRLEMLVRQRNGIDDTIRRHQAAIELLEQSGAPCLDGIVVEVAA